MDVGSSSTVTRPCRISFSRNFWIRENWSVCATGAGVECPRLTVPVGGSALNCLYVSSDESFSARLKPMKIPVTIAAVHTPMTHVGT